MKKHNLLDEIIKQIRYINFIYNMFYGILKSETMNQQICIIGGNI